MQNRYRLVLAAALLFPVLLHAACSIGQTEIRIQVIPDSYPAETHWSLRDFMTGALIDTGDTNNDTICLNNNQCVVFTIFDDFGDGICCAYGSGSYQVFVNNVLSAQGGSFGRSEAHYLNCPQGTSCSNPRLASRGIQTAPAAETWYLFVPDSTGNWQFNTCNLGNTCDPILYIYDHCAGLITAENNQGTTFYNDDACPGNQSLINAGMMAGDTFYIRVGDFGSSCAGLPISWQIMFNGAVTGCTDSSSCNYNPMATVSDGSCVYPPSPLCPAPDLAVMQNVIESSLVMDDLNVNVNNCYVDEGCLNGYGNRRIMRFSTHIKNIGNEDYYIGAPGTANPQFIWGGCHNHWHYEGYANYRLFDVNQQEMQVGFKNGFCVLDLECSGGGTAKFGCGNMGITAGCGDIYSSGLDCQWIDVTDVDTGIYTLVVTVNWDRSPDRLGRMESRFDNNWAQVCFNLTYDQSGAKVFNILPSCPPIVDCAGDTFGNAALDCAGVCGGPARTGDLNADTVVNQADVLQYVSVLTSAIPTATVCTDLNGDGQISLTDAARLNGCLLFNSGNHTHPGGSNNQHNHCDFPYNVYNPYDSMIFAIADTNLQGKYIDLSIYNPIGRMLGVELKLHGLRVDSARNIALGNYDPQVSSSPDGRIVVFSSNENSLFRQIAPLHFVRVYFDTLTDTLICLEQIRVALNDNYEEVATGISGNCILVLPSDTAGTVGINSKESLSMKVFPNPAIDMFDVYLQGGNLRNASFVLRDIQGRTVFKREEGDNLSNHCRIETPGLSPGLYMLSVEVGHKRYTQRLVIQSGVK